MKTTIRTLAAGCLVGFIPLAAHAGGTLNIYNWGEYFAPDTIANFEKESGIKVRLDVYDSNEVLQTKLLAGGSGYDLVFPSNDFLSRQIQSGVYQKLDKSKLPNLKNLDPAFVPKVNSVDPGMQYSVPYMWGTTAIGYNVDKVKKALGGQLPANSYELLFNPAILAKLQGCGVAYNDAGSAMFPLALRYVGRDPNSTNPKDYEAAAAVLQQARPHVRRLIATPVMNDLANGEVCVSTGYSGAVLVAKLRARDSKTGNNIAYSIPQSGAPIWFDSMVIPKDAKNVDNAHKFINYILRPDVVARISNAVMYPSPNAQAVKLMSKDLTGDPMIFPDSKRMQSLWVQRPFDPATMRLQTRLWQKFKTGR
ncbi:polyamine ABC transporter substrate-binding protein [Vogesella facilis]|uniref:Putrescine-binding periplasmic protein n=1 Tax=Vogesella facilis TaxID=1655232 RepID=A0ABV7RCQ2_9NEIS